MESKGSIKDWMLASALNSYVEILTPKVMGLEGWAFLKWLDHEGGALVTGIVAL